MCGTEEKHSWSCGIYSIDNRWRRTTGGHGIIQQIGKKYAGEHVLNVGDKVLVKEACQERAREVVHAKFVTHDNWAGS